MNTKPGLSGLLIVLLLLLWVPALLAQAPLPVFEVRDIGSGRIVVSWENQYPYTAQITIQRSFDSLSGYKSILTVPDPTAQRNGFADTKATNDHMFYRLYIQLDKGQYLFTVPQRPVKSAAPVTEQQTEAPGSARGHDAASAVTNYPSLAQPVAPRITESAPSRSDSASTASLPTSPAIPVKKIDPVIIKLDGIRAGDSARTPFSVVPQNDPDAYAPSLYVYTRPDGNVQVEVPNKKRFSGYRIRFYEANKQLLFELKQLPAPGFLLDKINFMHSGWFFFELFEDSRLIEKHKFYLDKDF